MKVYVLLRCVEYEGDDIMGVFATQELAERFRDEQPKEDYDWFTWAIYDWDVQCNVEVPQ